MPVCINIETETNERRCIKYVLVAISLTFLLTSVLLFIVGGITYPIYENYSEFLEKSFAITPIILLAAGSVTLLIAVFGIVGAFRQNIKLTIVYYLFGLVFVLEILMATAEFVLHSLSREMLIRTLNTSIAAYPHYESVANAVDLMQQSLECCGVDGPSDWNGILSPDNDEFILVPKSCCAEYVDLWCEEYFLSGCLDQLHPIIAPNVKIVAIGMAIAVCIHIVLVSWACLYKLFAKENVETL